MFHRPHHLFARRMFWRLHAAFVVIAVASGLCAATTSHLIAPPQAVPPPIVPLAQFLAGEIDPAHPDASVDALSERFHVRLTLWDPALAVIGASHEAMDTPDANGPIGQWLRFRHGPAMAVQLPDGRWLGLGYQWHWEPARMVLGMGIAGVVSALFLYPLARSFTGRLERLQATVERWGNGDFAARAQVRGHDEVAELGRRFNQAAERIQQLLDAQRRMLASASHELRSPLARVRMATELLDDGSPEHGVILAEAVRDIEELDMLVGDLLLASRLQSGATVRSFGQVDLGEIAATEARRCGATARGSAVIQGDAKMLRRAIRNLLENAQRHGAGPEIEISVVGGPSVEFRVEDRGPGVLPTERDRIFEPFYRPQGHAEGRDGGVGLGLALVRDIARHHRGDVRFQAREGGGSTFIVSIGGTA